MPATVPLLAPGTRLGVYEIVTMLGAGGMGAVYKARDTRLGRPVALKLLSPMAIANAEARILLEREARAIARLNHPHVCILYDLGHHEDIDYLVMEFVAGETLRDQLERGRLAHEDVLRYATQIAGALAEAHRAGVQHGDLKPGNIMIAGNGVKVLDFGLARPLGLDVDLEDALSTASSRDNVGGTLPYSAPEQLESGRSDARSDIFSYGVLLYEMVSGHRPFTGATEAALAAAVLRCSPAPLQASGPGIQTLRRVIGRCLVKDPGQRWQSIDEIVAELKAVRTPARGRSGRAANSRAGVHAVRRLVVLPFENRSPDSLDDYVVDGLTDALTSALSNIRQLSVIARTSTRQLQNALPDVPTIARMFGVNGVIRAVVSGNAERIHAHVELIDPGTDAVLWSDTYDRPLTDVLRAQDEIAVTMAMTLRLKFSPGAKRARAGWSEDPAVNDAYLRGRYFLDRATVDGLHRSFQHLTAAVQKDPTHGRAFAALAEWYVSATPFRLVARSEALPKSREAALRAIKLDPHLDEAHTCLGLIATLEWDLRRAGLEFAHALRLNPNSVHAARRLAHCLSWLGRFQDATSRINRVKELDPISPKTLLAVASISYQAGDYHNAVEAAQATLAVEPACEPAQYFLGMARHFAAQSATAIDYLAEASRHCPALLSGLAFVRARVGDTDGARRVIDQMKDRASSHDDISPYDFAEAFIGLGDERRALEYLERACDLRLSEMIGVGVDPIFQPLRDSPHFRRLVRTIGLDTGAASVDEWMPADA